jgi:hypothetical protein
MGNCCWLLKTAFGRKQLAAGMSHHGNGNWGVKTSEQFSIGAEGNAEKGRGEGNSEESRAEGNLEQKEAEREKEVREGEQNYIIIEYWNVNIGMNMCNKKKPPPMTIVFKFRVSHS